MASSRLPLCGTAMLVILGQSAHAWADCYVDSNNGDDSKSGQSEAEAVKTQTAIDSGCTTIRYKRGSVFNEAVRMGGGGPGGGGGNKTYTNYGNSSDPLPAFVVQSGSVVSAFQGGVSIDGLHLEGSRGDGTMENLIQGVCVMLGGNSKLLNSEITQCDIGIMLSGDNSLVQGNVIHDLRMAVDSTSTDVYVNSVGGAEGIFINGSNNEIAYNTFFNCKAAAEWTGGGCDGGATEVTVREGGTVTGVRVHHNFSYNNCGFFEVSGNGTFADSEFYYNVSIDSGWMFLLQVNETTLSNVRWENNTIVHHSGSDSTPVVSMIYPQGATLTQDAVAFNNNLVIFDNVSTFQTAVDAAISQSNNLIVSLPNDPDPGVRNLAGTKAEDFDLLESSPARDKGMTVAGHNLDYLNRTAPDPGGLTDIGAFEYGSAQGAPLPESAQPTAPLGATSSPAAEESGCGCRVAQARTRKGFYLGLLGLLCLGFGRRRKR